MKTLSRNNNNSISEFLIDNKFYLYMKSGNSAVKRNSLNLKSAILTSVKIFEKNRKANATRVCLDCLENK